MVQAPVTLKESASQTAGPYVHIGLTPNFAEVGVYASDLGATMVNDRTRGARITVKLRVLDGAGSPLTDALIELWQADADGLYKSPSETRGSADENFAGWGRRATDMASGICTVETIKPGRVPFTDGSPMAPHLSLWVVARGINLGLNTRMYFPDEEEANAGDPVLARIESPARRATLIARREAEAYVFDVHLQGDDETVFFDI